SRLYRLPHLSLATLQPPRCTLFPYTTLFRSLDVIALDAALTRLGELNERQAKVVELRFFGGLDIEQTGEALGISPATVKRDWTRSEEHTSELQSRENLVCRLLLEKKNAQRVA